MREIFSNWRFFAWLGIERKVYVSRALVAITTFFGLCSLEVACEEYLLVADEARWCLSAEGLRQQALHQRQQAWPPKKFFFAICYFLLNFLLSFFYYARGLCDIFVSISLLRVLKQIYFQKWWKIQFSSIFLQPQIQNTGNARNVVQIFLWAARILESGQSITTTSVNKNFQKLITFYNFVLFRDNTCVSQFGMVTFFLKIERWKPKQRPKGWKSKHRHRHRHRPMFLKKHRHRPINRHRQKFQHRCIPEMGSRAKRFRNNSCWSRNDFPWVCMFPAEVTENATAQIGFSMRTVCRADSKNLKETLKNSPWNCAQI